MSIERIQELHERASDCYLNGDYAGAIEAWREVLRFDPENAEAQDGVGMASQFVGPEAPPLEQELEQGLKVLDGLDLGPTLDTGGADGATDRPPIQEDVLGDWEAPSAVASESEESVGLEPVPSASPTPTAAMSPAGAELQRRVFDLLSQAKSKAEAGERDEALAVLARLAILDEDNVEAAQLRTKLDADGASDLDRVERAIIEGVAAIEAEKLDEAERYFNEALSIAPHHREAQHYLEKIAERRASSEDLLGGAFGEAAPAENAVAQTVPAEPKPEKPKPGPQASRAARPAAEVSDPPPAASSRRIPLPSPKLLLVGGGGLLVIALAVVAIPRLSGGGAKPAPAPPVSRPKPPVKAAIGSGAAPTPVKPSGPSGMVTVADALKEGRARLAAGDPGAAVLAFNHALSIDPASAEAKAGFEEARDRYNAEKEERDALNTITLAFRDGEFTSALRLAYRLPPTVSKTYTDGVKLAGWYNLAVVALRAGDCKGAMTQIDEALAIDAGDAQAKELKELAARYAEAVKDRGFFDRVEALAFRGVPPA